MKRLYRIQMSFDVVALLDDHIEDCPEWKDKELQKVLEEIVPEFDGGATPTQEKIKEIRSLRGLPKEWDGSEIPFGDGTRETITSHLEQIKRKEKLGC